MPHHFTARVALAALALLAVAPASAGAWPHWHHRGGHGWPRDTALRSLPAGDGPNIATLDPATRTLYVSNDASNDVSVIDIDRRDDASPRVPVGAVPTGLAVNDRTLYVANIDDGTVSVIDAARCNAHATAGCGGPVATITVGGAPLGVAVDPPTDTIYVGDPDRDTVAVIDGRACNRSATAGCAAPPLRAAAAQGAAFPTVDAQTRTLYVPGVGVDDGGTTMAVIDIGACNARVATGCSTPPATVPTGRGPLNTLVDPATHTAYVTLVGELSAVAVVDVAHCRAGDTAGCAQTPAKSRVSISPADGLTLDRGTLYVPGDASDTLSAIDTARCNARDTSRCDTRWPTLAAGNTPFWTALDAPTGRLFVNNYVDDAVSVLDARACSAQRRDGCRDEAPSVFVDDAFSIAISQKAHTAYVTHANLHDLVLFDTTRCSARTPERCTPVVAPVPGVSGPFDIAFDAGTDTLYATNQGDRTVVLIDPATCNARRPNGCAPVRTIQLADALNVAVDTASHAVYVTDDDHGTVSVIDGRRCNVRVLTGCTVQTVPAGEGAFGVTTDPVTGSVYVSNLPAGTVTLLDRGGIKATIGVGANPQLLELDPVTRKLYVPNSAFGEEPGSVSVIDTAHCTVRDTSGCGRTAPRIATGRGPVSVAIDPTTHLVYTADLNHSTSTVIKDGRVVATVPVGFFPWDVAVDPASKTVYLTDNAEGRVSFIAAR